MSTEIISEAHVSATSFSSFTRERAMIGLKPGYEISRIQHERRQKAVAWITQPEHQVKRRVLRTHLQTTLEASHISEPARDLLTTIGGLALGWESEDHIKQPVAVCRLSDIKGSRIDNELQHLLGDLPRVVRTYHHNRDIEIPIDDYHLILPNGNTTYDIVTMRRTVAAQPEIGPQSVYTVASEILKI